MKTVDVEEATASLSDYARRHRKEAVVVTAKGKPMSALLPLERDADLERLALSVSPRFQAILQRGRAQIRAGKLLSDDEMRRHFGIETKRKARAR